MKTTRRNFLAKSLLMAAGITTCMKSELLQGINGSIAADTTGLQDLVDPEAFKISIFSKHLQWLDYNGMSKALGEIGFDGVDLTVRPQGHVLPERVEEDLPKAVESVEKAGKKVYMITTSIDNADDPLTVKILKTASALGIRHYRMGYGHYDNNRSVEDNISSIQMKLGKLAELNEKFSISGEYQNHSGRAREGIYFGGAIWDIANVLKNINSRWLGAQYDIYHATVEGANTWPIGFKLISPYIRSIDIKDFKWTERDGKVRHESVPLGEGMVDFRRYFLMLKDLKINVPVSVHYEYPLGGAENGASEITMKSEDVITVMRKDLEILKQLLKEAKLV